MNINRDWIFQTVITILISLITFLAAQIYCQQKDISGRIRVIELQQARIMERMGLSETAISVDLEGVQRHFNAALENQ